VEEEEEEEEEKGGGGGLKWWKTVVQRRPMRLVSSSEKLRQTRVLTARENTRVANLVYVLKRSR
jgi:hypothetical protein